MAVPVPASTTFRISRPASFHPLLHPTKVTDFHIFVSFAKVQGPEDQVHKRMETFSLSPFCYNRLLQSKVLDFVTILRMGEVSTIFQQQKTTKPLFLAVPWQLKTCHHTGQCNKYVKRAMDKMKWMYNTCSAREPCTLNISAIDPENLKKQKDKKSIAFQRAGSVSRIGQENEAFQPAGFFRGAQSHLHLFLENLHLFLGNSNLGDNGSGHLA